MLTDCATARYIHNQIAEAKVALEAMLLEIENVESQYKEELTIGYISFRE